MSGEARFVAPKVDFIAPGSITDVLTRAGNLIANEADWWNGDNAQIRAGARCAIVAVGQVAATDPGVFDSKAIVAVEQATLIFERAVGQRIVAFNDSHSHAEVVGAFRKAAALALAEGK